jgi:hypothetical protein
MPTPVLIDGFEHQTLSTSGTGIWSAVSNAGQITIDTTNKRTGTAALRVAEDGVSATWIAKSINSQVVVGSLYLRLTATPSTGSTILTFTGPASNPDFRVNTSGTIRATIGGSSGVDGPNIVDGDWHRLDFRISTNSTTYTIEWSVDGATQTTSSLSGQTATAMTTVRFGGVAASTATVWYDDVVLSHTSADHPIGAHKVLSLVPDADGTNSGAANFTLVGGSTNWEVLDEWPADTTTYIAQTTNSGTSYREVEFADTTETTIWGVHGYLAYFAAGTQANNGTTRIVDSGGTTLTDIFSGDMSESTLFYRSAIITAPTGGWTQTGLNGVRGRVGFSTDVSPNPRWSALMLQYAVPEAENVTIVAPMATATAASLASTQGSTLLAPRASASADGTAPSLLSTIPAPQATATAAGLAPSIIIGPVTVIAPQATAIADAVAPGLALQILAPAADATATAVAPVLRLDVTVPLATATAGALAPSLVIGFVIQAPVAEASASAPAPAPTISVTVPLATATADALAPTLAALLSPPLAAATAAALAPTLSEVVQAVLATATAQGAAPAPTIIVPAALAQATAEAIAPVIVIGGGDVVIVVPLASAAAAAFAPILVVPAGQYPESWWQKPRYWNETRDALRRRGMPSWRG